MVAGLMGGGLLALQHRFRVLVSYAQVMMGPALAPACALAEASESGGIAVGWKRAMAKP